MEWISVKDRLPKTNVYVLVIEILFGDREIRIASFSHINSDGSREWEDIDDDYWGSDDMVTHWMPLPEPPNPQDAAQSKE